MRYANSTELSQFHDSFLKQCAQQAISRLQMSWGFPSGTNECDTFSFDTQYGIMYIGHSDNIVPNRCWMPIGMQSQRTVNDLTIAFEVNIPRTMNKRLSVHFTIDDDNHIHILHKGKVTAKHGLSMNNFFNYYRNHPGQWPVIQFSMYNYLELGIVSMEVENHEFLELLDSLAIFANYIPAFKDNYRST
jgi:hypothetical protein